jgi:uridine kinase
MARFTPLKRDVLDSLADEFLHNYGSGRTMIAIDGIDGAGKTRFSRDFATRLGRSGHAVFHASINDFHRPRTARYQQGRDSAHGFYHDAYDYDLFRRVLVNPFKLGGSTGFVTAAFDVARDAPIQSEWQTGPQDATLIVDGLFLNRASLRGLWNFSIWLELEPEVAFERLESMPNPPKLGNRPSQGDRYVGAELLYMNDAHPRAAASAIVDNTDADHPRRVFEDSC